MYFKLVSMGQDEKLSYLLSKNPSSPPFEREIGCGVRKVFGKYVTDPEGVAYEVVVRSDMLSTMRMLRDKNLPSYVTAAPYAVTPRNLTAVTTALTSAIAGRAKGVEDQEIARPRMLKAVIGPFLAPERVVFGMYDGMGLSTRKAHGEDVCVYEVSTIEPLSLAGFLQRVFVGAYAMSVRNHEERSLDASQIESLIRLSEGWLGGTPSASRVVEEIGRGRKELRDKFYESLENEDTEESDDDLQDVVKEPLRLHERRHATIVKSLAEVNIDEIVDLGCGDGSLVKQIVASKPTPPTSVLAMDGDLKRVLKMRRRSPKSFQVKHCNILLPDVTPEQLRPTVLVCSEVIEHLDSADRNLLIHQIAKMWMPKIVFITTPNVAWNESIGLEPGQMRHGDHRIEYSLEELDREVITPLTDAGYSVELIPLDGLEKEAVQPSFVVRARWFKDLTKADFAERNNELRHVTRAYSPVVIESVGHSVPIRELAMGYTHDVYNHYHKGAFYLSPTMAPVDHDSEFPGFLEHPAAALRYYSKRGVKAVVGQKKHMGSRAHVLAFRSMDHAKKVGMDRQVTVTSRGGYPFFKEAEHALFERLFLDSIEWGTSDFVALDGELLPWSLKAQSLIRNEFRAPAKAAALYKSLLGEEPGNIEAFLKALDLYAADTPMEYAVFGVLAAGNVTQRGYGNLVLHHKVTGPLKQCGVARSFFPNGSDLVKVTGSFVFSTSADERAAAAAWEQFCESGAEGMVFKPYNGGTEFLPDGAPMQPALKVRGKEYLRLIYGWDYTDADMFSRLTRRNTSAKRRVALTEHALGEKILMSYFRNMRWEHRKYVAAFLGMDGVASQELDKTL